MCSLILGVVLRITKRKICLMDMKRRWYLHINKNIKEGVNFINFASKFQRVYFDRYCQNKVFNIWNTRLATLLESASWQIFKVNFQKFFLFYLWLILCFKVGDNGDYVFTRGIAIDGVLNPAQNGSVMVLETLIKKRQLLTKARNEVSYLFIFNSYLYANSQFYVICSFL